MEWREKGRKDNRCREEGSRTSAMTSGTVMNLSAQWVSLSPPLIMALASTTATAMPLADLQLSTKTPLAGIGSWLTGFGGGGLFSMLLQHGAGAVSSIVLMQGQRRQRMTIACERDGAQEKAEGFRPSRLAAADYKQRRSRV